MEEDEVTSKLKKLARLIEYHNNFYYNEDNTEISDAD